MAVWFPRFYCDLFASQTLVLTLFASNWWCNLSTGATNLPVCTIALKQYWAPQIYTQFRNRKVRKTAKGVPQPQIRKFAVTFRTSAIANAHCTSANIERNIYCYFVFVMIFFFLRSNFAVDQTLTSKKKWSPTPGR